MTDTQSFIEEIMSFLTEDDIIELGEKAGVRFPIRDHDWDGLCYICCWMAMKRDLPESLHNRMVLGPSNGWSKLYINVLGRRSARPPSIEELFILAG